MTRAIATSAPGSAYWRLSIADVDRDGAFSPFPGLSRILTVIEGNGMRLDGNEQVFNAQPLSPVSFSGDLSIDGHLLDGPVQNFNLIFDPLTIQAQVLVGSVPRIKQGLGTDCDIAMIYCLAGTVQTKSAGALPAHTGAFITHPADLVSCSETCMVLWIRLQEI